MIVRSIGRCAAGLLFLLAGCEAVLGPRSSTLRAARPPEAGAAEPAPGPRTALPAGGALEEEDLAFLPPLLRPTDPALLRAPRCSAALELLRAGDARAAAIVLGELTRDGTGGPQGATLHAWALLQMGDLQAALARARAALGSSAASDPAAAWPPAAFVLGTALAQEGRHADALPWLRRALASGDDPALLERGCVSALAAGEPAFALECADARLRAGPAAAELVRLRAQALSQLGRHEEARAEYDRLLAQDPDDVALWVEAGLAAFEAGRSGADADGFRRAAACFGSAAVLEPQNARVQYDLGCALDWGGDAAGAEAAYRRTLEMEPGYLRAAENLAELLRLAGQPEEARSVLRELLRQPLSRAEVERVEARLRGLEGGGG